MKKIFVKHHLGLGDGIIHNGMVRKISEDNPGCEIYCAAKEHNYNNIMYMYRDNEYIKVISVKNDDEMTNHIHTTKYDFVISSHFEAGSRYSYEKYGDDAFYLQIDMNPEIKTSYFHIKRDYDKELELFEKLTNEIGSKEYIFIHEKPNENIFINRDKINSNLPIISASPEHDFFYLLTIIERAKEVHVISSSFLSFFMAKKINPKTYAHMYSDSSRIIYTNMVKNSGVDVIL